MSEPLPSAEEISQSYDFTGKTALVTGANGGIGKETARVLALRGCHVIMGCRSVERGEQARQDIIQSTLGQDKAHLLEVMALDLSSLLAVRDFCDRFAARGSQELHYLVANAGVMPVTYQKTAEGFETHFGVNHLAHFLLVLLMIPYLKASAPARVVVVSSDGHFAPAEVDLTDVNSTKAEKFDPDAAYCLSKLHNVLFANELNRRLKGTGVTSSSLHPGLIVTDIGRELGAEGYMKNMEFISDKFNVPIIQIPQGAATTLYALGCREGVEEGGFYFKNCAPAACSDKAKDENLAKQLWELSENLTLATFPERPL